MDYRKLYKSHFNIEFDDKMEVHHIDGDRSNNNIDNLLLLPESTHSKFHFSLNALGGRNLINNYLDPCLKTQLSSHSVAMIQVYAESLSEIYNWIMFKEHEYIYCNDKRINRL